MKIHTPVLLAIATTVLAACASSGGMASPPYALFEPDQRSVPSDTRPAFILEIDGEPQVISQIDPVRPGVRKLVVSVPAGIGTGGSRRETITIDAKPCVHYYLAARRASAALREWSAFIAGTEPISGCRTNLTVN